MYYTRLCVIELNVKNRFISIACIIKSYKKLHNFTYNGRYVKSKSPLLFIWYIGQLYLATVVFYGLQVFILLPVIFLACSIYLVVAPIIQDPRLEFLYAALFMVGGLVFYIPLVHFQLMTGPFGKYLIKLLLNVLKHTLSK